MRRPEDIELGPHGMVDQTVQVTGERCVALEPEVHITGHIAVTRDPDFAVTEPSDGRDAAVDRPSLLATDGDIGADAVSLPDVDLLHRQRVPLQQPTDHLR